MVIRINSAAVSLFRLSARLVLAALLVGIVAACAENVAVDPPAGEGASVDTSSVDGQVFSAAEEDLYLARFERMVEAFSSGGSITSIYDTMDQVPGDSSPVLLGRKLGEGLSESAPSKIISYVEARNSSALIVVKGGNVILEAYFGSYDQDDKLNGKSLAKPLSVIAVGRAIMAGHIDSLDQPASDFIEEWKDTPKEVITIRQLLGMRSGLEAQSGGPTPDHIMNRAYLHPRHDEIIINEYPLKNVPGERYDYSNANAELIAPIIQRATGRDYASWVSTEIIQKLNAGGGDIWLNRTGGTAHSGCCILLPAETFAKIGLLVMRDGVWEGEQLLPKGYADAMRQGAAENIHAGLGLYLGHPYKEYRGANNPDSDPFPTYHSEPYARDDLYLFDGNSNQVVYMIPSEDLLILRLGATPSKEQPWDNAILPNMVLEALSE